MNKERLWEQVKAAVKAAEEKTSKVEKPYTEVRKGDVIRRRPITD